MAQAFPAFIDYFDSVDRVVSSRLLRKRPWLEVALTQLLCELLDEDTADDHVRTYTLAKFRRELASAVTAGGLDCTLSTHEYVGDVERWATQSDIGLILEYRDHFLRDRSWKSAWLLQAKRLFPNSVNGPFDEQSRFGSRDVKQHERILRLNEILAYDAVKYLLYCPRSDALDSLPADKLKHLRDSALSEHDRFLSFFDDWGFYSNGLMPTLDQLQRRSDTLAAGLIISEVEPFPTTLAKAHASIFDKTIPLAWFIALQYRGGIHAPGVMYTVRNSPATEFAVRLASGDQTVVEDIAQEFGQESQAGAFPILPAHTIHLVVAPGSRADPDRREINLQDPRDFEAPIAD